MLLYCHSVDELAVLGNSLRSYKRNFNHSASQIPKAIPPYSASALDLATTFCFLLLHITKFPPTKVKYPEVDHLSSIALD